MEKNGSSLQFNKLRNAMDRYYEGEDFYEEKDDDDEGDDEKEDGVFIDQDQLMDAMGMDLAKVELNHDLLDKAIKIASANWFWKFRSTSYKIKQIDSVYQHLQEITQLEEDDFDENSYIDDEREE